MSLRIGVEVLADMIVRLRESFEENSDYLNDLDSRIGDGDHGLSMVAVRMRTEGSFRFQEFGLQYEDNGWKKYSCLQRIFRLLLKKNTK